MKRLMLLLLISLAGCANGPTVISGPNGAINSQTTSPVSGKHIDTVKPTVEIDPYLLEDCAWFKPMTATNPTANQVLEQKASDVATLRECIKRHHSLVKIVKDAFNVK